MMLSAGLQPPQRLHSGANSPHVSVLLAGQHGLNARCSTRIPFGKGIHKISEDNPRSVRTTQAVAETAVGAGSGNLPAPVLPSPSQLALARRMLQVSFAATKFLSVLASTKWDQAVMGLPSGKERAAETLQELLTSLGPAFVKLAQTLSMRPDLIGDVYAGALVKLQDNVRPFPNEVAYQILEKELGKPLDQIFISLSTNPVASASLGQVYRGILRPEYGGGGSVAVKVQRPGAAESIALDVQLLRQLLGLVRRVLGIRRNLGVLADEIGAALQGECDFRNEVFNAQEFAKAHANLTFIITPRAVTELCTRKVLVSEWVDGRSPSQLLMPQKAGESAEDENSNSDVLSLVRMGIQCSLAQLLVTGCMHGDPHSGNLLLTKDGRLCYLDFGLVVRVTPEHRQAMMAALVHVGLGEWARLVDDLRQLDLLKPGTDQEQLAKDLEKEFTAVVAAAAPADSSTSPEALSSQLPLLSLQTSSLSFRVLAGVLFRVSYKYRFLLPSYFPLVVRSIASLEGVALLVDPNFKLVAAGMPVVLNQLLSDRRPAAQALLRELLLAPGGALRTDETTRQILQVWLSAAQQSARADALAGKVSAKQAVSTTSSAVDMTSLLLDRRNVPLRRTLIMSNPAATIAKMPQDMREELLHVLTEALSSEEGTAAAAELLQSSAAARAQRKRLWMMFKASVPKVMNSPPRNILSLVKFTLAVGFAVTMAFWKQIWKKIVAFFRHDTTGSDAAAPGALGTT